MNRKLNSLRLILSGLVVSLSVCLLAFEWRIPVDPFRDVIGCDFNFDEPYFDDTEEELIPITYRVPPKPKPLICELVKAQEKLPELEEDLENFDHLFEDEGLKFWEMEEPAVFPGGERALFQFLAENIRYPLKERACFSGRVYVRFVILETGEVSEIEIVRGSHPALDKEALRVIGLLPNWKPANLRGKAIKTTMALPIRFTIN